jgi:hypothetical protein
LTQRTAKSSVVKFYVRFEAGGLIYSFTELSTVKELDLQLTYYRGHRAATSFDQRITGQGDIFHRRPTWPTTRPTGRCTWGSARHGSITGYRIVTITCPSIRSSSWGYTSKFKISINQLLNFIVLDNACTRRISMKDTHMVFVIS